jgi:hypothetical protein
MLTAKWSLRPVSTNVTESYLHNEVRPRRMVHVEVVRSVGVDRHVAGDGHAFLVDGSAEIEVLDKRGNINPNLSTIKIH